MTLRRVILVGAAFVGISDAVLAQRIAPADLSGPAPSSEQQVQDFSQTVIPLHKTNPVLRPHARIGSSFVPGLPVGIDPGLQIGGEVATAFCLDSACRLAGTNYHVAASMRLRKIDGRKVIRQYLATGPQDHDATWNSVAGEPMAFAMNRDLAIIELREPLPHRRGLIFSLDQLEHGERVDIYGYPFESSFRRRKLLRFPATFRDKTASGILVFDYQLADGKPLRGGASGGIVVNSKSGQIVGVISSVGRLIGHEAYAVPVQSLADFVQKTEPFLAHEIFRSSELVSPVPGDLYSKYAPPSDFNSKFIPIHQEGLQHRPKEPEDVTQLRSNAQALVDSMRYFIAVQSFAWGSGTKEPRIQASFEVRVLDKDQRYRAYPDGKKEMGRVPFPPMNDWIMPGDDWSDLPKMIGTKLNLRIHQARDVEVNKHRMKVFQYDGSVEDDACGFSRLIDFGFFVHEQPRTVSCYGEVWTDERLDILRISQTLELPPHWGSYHGVVTYDWLKREGEPDRLIPVTFYAEWHNEKHVDWCRGQFTDYRVFDVKAKVGSYK